MNLSTQTSTERPWRVNGLLLSLIALLVIVEVFTVFAVLASQRFATDRALREHTHELLQNVVDETRENAAGYLQQAQDSVSLATGIFEAALLSGSHPEQLERYFLEQLRVIPQIDAMYFGDIEGNFIFSKRDARKPRHGFFSKFIQKSLAEKEQVILINRDPCLVEVSREKDPTDTYDPRVRPWFELAQQAEKEIWTDPYIFYTSQLPGLTVARAVRDGAGRLHGVIGADIELSALSEFLTKQRVGSSGAAFIIYSNGDVLAHPYANEFATRDGESKTRLRQLAELDPITAQAGSRLKERFPDLVALNYTHFDRFEVGDQRYMTMFVPLLSRGNKQWIMGVYAPEDEMAHTIREGQRESIFLGVAMSLLVITGAVLIGLMVLRPISTLQRQAREDPLTGLLNRRSFDDAAAAALTKARRDQQPFSAIMIDIDLFKPINDEYGHAVGDEVLLVIARRLNRGLSDDDLLSRHGGEEFAIVLPDSALEQGIRIAERLREMVSAEPVKTKAGPLNLTISLGVTEIGDAQETLAELLHRADQGLLTAKRLGRDRVIAI